MSDVERGQRMKELREAAGLLQRQVGAEFDIDKAAVSEWERGRSSPDKAKLVRLDELYQANGEVLTLYGVNGSVDYVTRSEFDQLRESIRGLATVVDRMERALREAGVLGGTPPHGQDRPSA